MGKFSKIADSESINLNTSSHKLLISGSNASNKMFLKMHDDFQIFNYLLASYMD